MRRVCGSLLMLLALAGCQTEAYEKYGIYNRSNLYLESELIEPLQVPAEINAKQASDRYDIPEIESVDLSVPPVSIVPPILELEEDEA